MNEGIQLTLGGLAMVLGLAAAGPFDWHTLITDFGFPICLVLFFVWNSWKREERIAARVTTLETFVQNELLDINKQAVKAIADNTAALNALVEAMKARPCLCEGPDLIAKVEGVAAKVDQFIEQVGKPQKV